MIKDHNRFRFSDAYITIVDENMLDHPHFANKIYHVRNVRIKQ
ncbi:hypothetical protein J2X97_000852 [Epilithonimonas hungarica]|nr:hypothetical protein [Epilithonimonas hungarica]